jgi:hypothetical protein
LVFIAIDFVLFWQKPDLCLKIVNAAVKHLRALVEEPVAHLCREEEELIIDACPYLPPYWNQMQFRQRVSQVSTEMLIFCVLLVMFVFVRIWKCRFYQPLILTPKFCKTAAGQTS